MLIILTESGMIECR